MANPQVRGDPFYEEATRLRQRLEAFGQLRQFELMLTELDVVTQPVMQHFLRIRGYIQLATDEGIRYLLTTSGP
jgi:hypothetical protein